jgi:hypothetical protein
MKWWEESISSILYATGATKSLASKKEKKLKKARKFRACTPLSIYPARW